MTDNEAWETEEQFWTGDAAYYERTLHPHCVMVFPPPFGVLTQPAIVDSIRDAPRWQTVEFADRHVSRPAADVVVIAYRASAHRSGAPAYAALCSSTYVRTPTGWQLALHQQTPAS